MIAPLDLPAPLVRTLDRLSLAAGGLDGPWWIFGSAAMRLMGAADIEAEDVDLLLGQADAERLAARLGAARIEGAGERFRSAYFAKAQTDDLRIEIMSGLEVRTAEGWRRVSPRTRTLVAWAPHPLPLPDREELIEICRLFGRPKDIARAAMLEQLSG
ncbi:hypothetical protein [Phenylobacterium sp.]|uniref:hypothetical protein n=1 Tax=Phenylobacterium sp. TaxID=1871053 RepID=UPI0027315990|nr:hypothetical protein [Phenylobacterium sp.]MDP1618270.1 hypothetical protein [Phenylobacterium sp.]MDP1988851.1 hypothetical protein [Phenylobacterium sp.]